MLSEQEFFLRNWTIIEGVGTLLGVSSTENFMDLGIWNKYSLKFSSLKLF